MCTSVCLQVGLCILLKRSEQGIGSPGTGVMVVSLDMVLANEPSFLEGQPVPLTTDLHSPLITTFLEGKNLGQRNNSVSKLSVV